MKRKEQEKRALAGGADANAKRAVASAATGDAVRHGKKAAFLDALRRIGSIYGAAQVAGIARQTVYRWRDRDALFARNFEDAMQDAREGIEQELRRRGMVGWDEPVFHQGVEVARVRKFDTTAAIFWLKGNWPDKYRENQRVELSGRDGAPIQVEGSVTFYLPAPTRLATVDIVESEPPALEGARSCEA